MKTISLGDCCRILSGGTPSKANANYWIGKIPWFSPKDIKKFELFDSQDHISQTAVGSGATHVLKVDSILVVTRSGVLAHSLPVGILRCEAAFNQDIKGIIPDAHFDPEFVALFLKANEGIAVSDGVKIGATVHSLKAGYLESLQLPDVSLPDQRRIAAQLKIQLAEVDKARQAAKAQLDEINLLPSRLLAQAFTLSDIGE